MLPLVSVLMPIHNHEIFVAAALDSVLEDGYPNVEIVACDDGSNDASYSVAAGWSERHPEVRCRLLKQANRGVGPTLNRLLSVAEGSYVAPLASDDMFLAGGIGTRLAAIRASGVRAAFGDARVIDEDGASVRPSFLDSYHVNRRRLERDLRRELILNWGVPGPVLLAETKAVREAGGYREDVVVEDWDLYLRLAARGWLTFVDATVASYRIHRGGASQRPENVARIVDDQRRVAESNIVLFTGHHRLLLRLMILVYTRRWRVPMRVVRKIAQRVDRLLP